jgi:hypothetical protein
MKKSINDNQKRRGRPATGTAPMVGVRMTDEFQDAIKAWAKKQPDHPPLAVAIRLLVELGLTVKSAARPTAKAAARAAELAAKAIDKHADTSAPSAERESRKNRLLKGPSVFWDVRKGM